MSAALQIPFLWAAQAPSATLQPTLLASATNRIRHHQTPASTEDQIPEDAPVRWAFYRKHTEKLLQRYLYASLQVGRSPNVLGESVDRGWVASRRIRTFEDALIFVLDIERCIRKLSSMDQQLLTRVILQEYSHAETAELIGLSLRSVTNRLPRAIDRLTEYLVEADLLTLPGQSL